MKPKWTKVLFEQFTFWGNAMISKMLGQNNLKRFSELGKVNSGPLRLALLEDNSQILSKQ